MVDQIRGQKAGEALNILRGTNKRIAPTVEKVLRSAVANAESTHALDGDELVVLAAYADEGPTLKRWRARARGRVNRIRKRTCHITLIVSENPKAQARPKRSAEKPAAAAAPTPDAPAGDEKPKPSPKKRAPAKKKEARA